MPDRSQRTMIVGQTGNVNYENDVSYVLEVCRFMSKPLGIWSLIYNDTSRLERTISVVLLTAGFCGLLFIAVPVTLHIIYEEMPLHVRIKKLGPDSYCILALIKYFYLALKGTAIGRCIEHVTNDWRTVKEPRHRDIMLKQAGVSRNLSKLCIVFIYTAGLSYHTVLPVLAKRRIQSNQTTRVLAYGGYDRFFDVQSSPNFEILYGLQCVAGFIKYNVTAAIFSLTVIFVTHICGQMQIQISRLGELTNKRREKDVVGSGSIGVIVQDHVEILRLSKNVGEAFSEIILIEIMGSTFLLCLAEYCCLMEFQAASALAITTYVVYMVSFTFNVFIFCYIGEILTEQCEQIGVASYEMDWYNLSPRIACNFMLLNVMSLYPPKLTGMNIIDLSLNTFSVVMKSSVVYLNLLQTVV